MRELNKIEVSDVSGGIAPLVFAIIGVDLALNGLLLAHATYAASRFRTK